MDWKLVWPIFFAATVFGFLLTRLIWQARKSRSSDFFEAMRAHALVPELKELLAWLLGGIVFGVIATPLFFLIMKISN